MIARRVVWFVVGAGALALGTALTPLVPSYDIGKLWLAVCVLVAASVAGLYYDAKAARRGDR